MGSCRSVTVASTRTIRLRALSRLSFTITIVTSRLCAPGQMVNELVEAEHAEAYLIVGRFAAALKQAGEGHGGRPAERRGQLQISEVRVGAGALVDHPGATPTVWIAGERAEEHTQVPASSCPCWVGVNHPGGGEEIWTSGCRGAG